MCWPEKNWNQLGSSKAGHHTYSSCLRAHAFSPFPLLQNSKLLTYPRLFLGRSLCCPGVGVPSVLMHGLEEREGMGKNRRQWAKNSVCHLRPLPSERTTSSLPEGSHAALTAWGERAWIFSLENYFSSVGEITVNHGAFPYTGQGEVGYLTEARPIRCSWPGILMLRGMTQSLKIVLNNLFW